MRMVGGMAAAVLVVAVAVGSPLAGGASAPPSAAITVSPGEVGPGGVVVVSGRCPTGGPEGWAALRAVLPASEPGGPFDVNRTIPLSLGSDFEADLVVPVDAPAGTYEVSVFCGYQDIGGPGADTTVVVTDDPPLPVAPAPAFTTVSPVRLGETPRVWGSCPATTPAADSVLIQDLVSAGNPSPMVTETTFPLAADGRFADVALASRATIAGTHHLRLFCLAGPRFLGDAATDYLAAAPTTTTTPSTTTTTAVGPSAPPAEPLPAAPALTG